MNLELETEHIVHSIPTGVSAGEKVCSCQGTRGIRISIRRRDVQFQGLAQQPEHDGVLSRIVSHSHRMITDLVRRTRPHLSLAPMDLLFRIHRGSDQLAELECRSTRRIFLEAMMSFNNFDIEVTAGNAANNVSKSELNHSTATTGTAQLKVTGISTDVENNTIGAANLNFVVMINEHLYNAKNNGI